MNHTGLNQNGLAKFSVVPQYWVSLKLVWLSSYVQVKGQAIT